MDSILTSIKKLLGIPEEVTNFDTDIIIHINTAFGILSQISNRFQQGFSISDAKTTWVDYLGEGADVEAVKTYVYLRVRLVFDPPTGAVLEAMKQSLAELDWRLSIVEQVNSEIRYE